MSKEQDNKDLERASWEGMQNEVAGIFIGEELAYFLTKVKAAFDSNHSYFGFTDAFFAVVTNSSEEELAKAKITLPLIKNEDSDRLLVDSFRSVFKTFLGEKKWAKFEHESLKRHLKNDLENGGTPG